MATTSLLPCVLHLERKEALATSDIEYTHAGHIVRRPERKASP